MGVDAGTSSARAIAFDSSGRARALASRRYRLRHPRPGRAELDPGEVVGAVEACLADCLSQANDEGLRVLGLCLSTFMHSLMALDSGGRPATSLITWADNRAERQAERLGRTPEARSIHARTGVPVHAMTPLCKLLWFAGEARDDFERAHSWVSLKDYLLERLCNERVLDHCVAATSGLFNLGTLDWDADLLETAGLRRAQLATPVATSDAFEATSRGPWGGLPVIAGAADGALANIGVGALTKDVMVCSVGTSGAIRATLPERAIDDRGATFCYPLDSTHWVVGGPINNGGVVLDWLLEKVFADLVASAAERGLDPHEVLFEVARQAPEGAEGLLFLPYLMGERAPKWDASARGALVGLTIGHGRPHIVRAALEGITLQLRSVASALEAVAGPARVVRATGGVAASELWLQTLADAFQRPVEVGAQIEGAALGAALLGMKSLGLTGSLASPHSGAEDLETYRPRVDLGPLYEELARSFESLYPLSQARPGDRGPNR